MVSRHPYPFFRCEKSAVKIVSVSKRFQMAGFRASTQEKSPVGIFVSDMEKPQMTKWYRIV